MIFFFSFPLFLPFNFYFLRKKPGLLRCNLHLVKKFPGVQLHEFLQMHVANVTTTIKTWDISTTPKLSLCHRSQCAPPLTPNPISNYFPLLFPSSSWAVSYPAVPEYAMQAPALWPVPGDTSLDTHRAPRSSLPDGFAQKPPSKRGLYYLKLHTTITSSFPSPLTLLFSVFSLAFFTH